MKVYISGTSCVGKSTYVAGTHKFPTVPGDYAEHVSEFPELWNRDRNPSLELAYMMLLEERSVDGAVHDRGPLDVIVYNSIRKVLLRKMDEGVVCAELAQSLGILDLKKSKYVIVLNHSHLEDVLGAMKRRDNGIDICNPDYIVLQNRIFRLVAEWLSLPVVFFTGDFEQLHEELDNVITQLLVDK